MRIMGFVWLMAMSLMAGCLGSATPELSTPDAAPEITPEQTATPFEEAIETPLPTDTPTPVPAVAYLVAGPGSDASLAQRLFTGLQAPLSQAGVSLEQRTTLSPSDLNPSVRLVIGLPPDAGVFALAQTAAQTQFVAVGFTGLQAGENLSVVGTQGMRPDQQGFMAGTIAAMITPDWRVGVLSVADTPAGMAARQGFLNGAVYFCGLCLAYHGPNIDYPLYQELPESASMEQWQAAAQALLDQAVKTIYLAPGMDVPEMRTFLAQSGVKIIGAQPMQPEAASYWVATIQPDPLPAILEVLPQLLSSQGGIELPLAIGFFDANPDLFSPGRQERAAEILAELLAGYIDTGVDPASGEARE
jgi:basic membrane lipoprotein Med (substrate-binding protein (PBP1-ABC) superfamily)